MIKVSVFFETDQFETKEEYLKFANLLMSNKVIRKYMTLLDRICTNMNMTPEAIIDDCFERNDKHQLITIFGIQSTKSIKALNLLNDIAKEHNYKYELWYASQGSASSMRMTIDQLLSKFNK